ncbi:hypothetical protein DH2020_029220 [Rehmannia glutinosa]|uniref:Uncharacterized protein n=1 Tax=Rehmannia glutinosa TaxID=99300 RepID=A0ABR0VS67_REHGL
MYISMGEPESNGLLKRSRDNDDNPELKEGVYNKKRNIIRGKAATILCTEDPSPRRCRTRHQGQIGHSQLPGDIRPLTTPLTCSPRDVQAAANKAAQMDMASSSVTTSFSSEDDDVSTAAPEELGEIVELPSLGTSYDLVEPSQEEYLLSQDVGWDYYNHPLLDSLEDCGVFLETSIVLEDMMSAKAYYGSIIAD